MKSLITVSYIEILQTVPVLAYVNDNMCLHSIIFVSWTKSKILEEDRFECHNITLYFVTLAVVVFKNGVLKCSLIKQNQNFTGRNDILFTLFSANLNLNWKSANM